MELINEAYEVETGNTGLAFKCQKRYLDLREVQPFLDNFYVLRLEPKSEIIGVVKARLIDDSSILDIGPLAVDLTVQVNIFFMKYISLSAHRTPNFLNPKFQFPQFKVLQSVFFSF